MGELEDTTWFASLLAFRQFGFGVVAMIADVVARPGGTKQAWHVHASRGLL